jgi:hypothetical protein
MFFSSPFAPFSLQLAFYIKPVVGTPVNYTMLLFFGHEFSTGVGKPYP